jgi:fructokinase
MSLAISWGELLWDVFDGGEERLGGCACNVAYHLGVLGQPVGLVTRVGRDARGDAALARLGNVGVRTELIQVDDHQATGVVRVDLSEEEPRYEILERVAWDRIAFSDEVAAALPSAAAFTFGTLAQRTPLAQETFARVLEALPTSCLKYCDLNLRRPFSLEPIIRAAARAADVVQLNAEESGILAELLDVEETTRWLIEECGVQVVFETLGERGVRVITPHSAFHAPGAPLRGHGDTVGAGDAFCARAICGLLAKEPLETVAREANRYAARVASCFGATPSRELLVG